MLDDWHDTVAPGAARHRRREQLSPARNPFKGLAAFEEPDAADFYGRTEPIDALVGALTQRNFVALVGPSGMGKSSVIHAGLLPALRAGAIPGSENWITATTTPGPRPFEQLASALQRVAAHAQPGLEHDLAVHPEQAATAADGLLPGDTHLLIVVDQLEELFTLTPDPAVRAAYLSVLAALAAPDRRVSIVVGIRADFFDRPLEYGTFGDLLRAGTVPLTLPDADELAEIIRRPAEAVGVTTEPGLVDLICDEVRSQPGGLPLLEYALTDLFEHRTADVITFEDYQASGGMPGALGRRAEALYQSFDPQSQDVTRRLFLSLVAVADAAPDLRRRVRRSELDRLDIDREALDDVIARFAAARLITLDRDPLTRGPTVEVAHEALFGAWSRLASWIDAHREDLLQYRRLSSAFTEWQESGEETAFLLT